MHSFHSLWLVFFFKLEEAFNAFKEAKDFLKCSHIRESQQRYKEAVEVLSNENMRIEALDLLKKYIKAAVTTEPSMASISDNLAHQYASLYAKQKNKSMLQTVLGYIIIPAPVQIATYWKECGEFRTALNIYIVEKMPGRALQVMYEQEWYDEGLKYATEHQMDDWFVTFAIQVARLVLKQHTLPCAVNCVMAFKYVQRICGLKSMSKWHPISELFLNFLKGDDFTLNSAVNTQQNKIGKLEAYGALFHLKRNQIFDHCKDGIKVVMDACDHAYRCAKDLSKEICQSNNPKKGLLHEVIEFYGIKQNEEGFYVIPPPCCMWTKNRGKFIVSPDLNGVVKLDPSKTNNSIVEHLKTLPAQYLQDSHMEQQLKTTEELYDAMQIRQYLDIHINWLHYCHFMKQQPRKRSIKHLMNTLHVYGNLQIETLRHNEGACRLIGQWIKSEISTISTSECQTNLLFLLWKASRIICKGYKELEQKIFCSKAEPYSDKLKVVHYFSIWMIETSHFIHDKKEKATRKAPELIIDKFIGHIIKMEITSKPDTKLLMSIFEIMTIYATGLLSRIARVQTVRVPTYYQYAVDLLESDENHSPDDDSSEVDVKTLLPLLSKCLKVLLYDRILETVLNHSNILTSCHYLILTLTILDNIAKPALFIRKLKDILTTLTTNQCPDIVAHALKVLSDDNNTVFTLIKYLLNQLCPYMRGMSQIIYKPGMRVEFVPEDLPGRETFPTEAIWEHDSTSESESDPVENYNEDDDIDD